MKRSSSMPNFVPMSSFSISSLIRSVRTSVGKRAKREATSGFWESSTYAHKSVGKSLGLRAVLVPEHKVALMSSSSAARSSTRCGSFIVSDCSCSWSWRSFGALYKISFNYAMRGSGMKFFVSSSSSLIFGWSSVGVVSGVGLVGARVDFIGAEELRMVGFFCFCGMLW